MIRQQLFLFPELDPFKTIIKDIDYMDASKIPEFKNVVPTKNKLSDLPEGKYILFKSGGYNRFLPELGNIFPYLQNMDTKYVYTPTLLKTYVVVILTEDGIGYTINLSRASASAFIVHPDPHKTFITDHINKNRRDYRLSNLRWTTQSQNLKRKDTSRDGLWDDKVTRYTILK